MKKLLILILIMFIITDVSWAQEKSGLKVLISVDMEGVTGVVNWEDVNRDGKDYDYFREIMTLEANAAVEGAVEAGADEIYVRDAHSSGRNILPGLLDKRAMLIRAWSGGYKVMMEGIDETFDAAIFVGYHAKANTPNGILDHTMNSSRVDDFSLNSISLPEAGINGIIAGYFNVPVVFVAGEKGICVQAKALFGEVETVAVKEGIGDAALSLHPMIARNKIRAGVKKALQNIRKYKPYKLSSPYTLVVQYKDEKSADEKSVYPGAGKSGSREVTFKSGSILEVIKAMSKLY